MSEKIEVPRPDRWDHPLDPDLSAEQVENLLQRPPFSVMDVERFARSTPLPDILRNDSRVLSLSRGDVIFREGEYGGTAYLVLSGRVRVALTKLLPVDGDAESRQSGASLLTLMASLWGKGERRANRSNSKGDRRKTARGSATKRQTADPFPNVDYRGEGTSTRVFLQDIPGVLEEHSTSTVGQGELFGEMAAVTRSPREFTAFAESDCTVLEMRWQGLKLLRQDAAFRRLLDERYRGEVLRTHLRETPLFRFLPDDALDKVVASAKLESFGDLEWYADYRSGEAQDPRQRIESEPLIAEEGEYAAGLWIVRGGFARLSQRQGAGYRTLAYLGKGEIFGLAELNHNFQRNHQSSQTLTPLPYQESLRAIGYVDALCISKNTVDQFVLPYVRQADLPPLIQSPRYQYGQPVVDAPLTAANRVDTGLLEFLVEERLINGQKSMVIDTDRCTRCDDCVKACASTHGGEPMFVREGPRYGSWMFPHACMHCADPVCMIGCPTGAIHRNYQTGVVEINQSTCIGCKTCAQSCPYDNIRMIETSDDRGRARVDEKTGLPILQASKCDFCSSSGAPACQTACPHDALVRINLGDVDEVAAWSQRSSD